MVRSAWTSFRTDGVHATAFPQFSLPFRYVDEDILGCVPLLVCVTSYLTYDRLLFFIPHLQWDGSRSKQSLLTDPNPASPANPEAAQLYQNDPAEYSKRVRRVAQRSIEC